MTTIVYRDGVLAADSRNMINGWKTVYPVRKIFQLKDGSHCAITGEYGAGVAFKDWLNSNRSAKRPSLAEATVIQMKKDELVLHEVGGSFQIETEFAAWGSGSPPAYGALYMGASAEKAVEIASLVDDQTGGEIMVVKRAA